jgi:hypothetical protein
MSPQTFLYVPVLKLKRAEKSALTHLDSTIKGKIVPLFEVVERRPERTLEEHLSLAFSGLGDSLEGISAWFLDTREIEADGEPAARRAFELARGFASRLVPVTALHRGAGQDPALEFGENGLCLRLSRADLDSGSLHSDVAAFMDRTGLSAATVDLVVDLGPVDDMVIPGIMTFAKVFLNQVPDISAWRSVILSACSFPRSMGIVDANSCRLRERGEWAAWQAGLFNRRSAIPRLPTYSDCAIQHTLGVEGFDPRRMQVSASIRYATPDNWLLVKGVSTRRIRAVEQFPVLAQKLAGGRLSAYYHGSDHCAGCAGIQACADHEKGLGSAEVWRRLGTIHHISLTVDALSTLYAQ